MEAQMEVLPGHDFKGELGDLWPLFTSQLKVIDFSRHGPSSSRCIMDATTCTWKTAGVLATVVLVKLDI